MILIGGATGVGKSTIATQLATRLGIVRVVATDAVREVMRAMLSPELAPTLHVVVVRRDTALREPPTRSADALVLGFREQTAAVSVGINALIERAALERTSVVIEGAHIVPGFFDVETHSEALLAVPFVVGVEQEERHRSHFAAREDAVDARPAKRYADGFREHPEAAALRHRPGARARCSGDPQPQLRPVDRRGGRPGDGAGDHTGGRASRRDANLRGSVPNENHRTTEREGITA